MRHAASCAVVVVATMVTVASAGPRLIFVDDDAAGASNGSSWANAYKYLQDALADARIATKPIEIRVAQGVYKPSLSSVKPTGWRPPSFQLISGVTVQGGYGGSGASDPNAHDALVYVSILSGDTLGNDGPKWESRSDNVSHVVTASGTDATAILDGFTITGGYAFLGDYSCQGSGMLNEGGSPTILNCTFSANDAGFGHSPRQPYSGSYALGGAAYSKSGNPRFVNCTFAGNSADYGGAVCCDQSSVTFERCTFKDNWAYEGGAIDGYQSKLMLTDCTFSDNEARGDLLWGAQGGGLYWEQGSASLTCCRFTGNRALAGSVPNPTGLAPGRGGALFYKAAQRLELRECIFTANSASAGAVASVSCSDTSLINCLATGNSCSLGGTIEVLNMVQTIPPKGPEAPKWNLTMTNCTFAGNRAPRGRTLTCDSWEYNAPSIVHITSCILWNSGDEVRNDDASVVRIDWSDISNAWGGEGNIDKDPLFAAPGRWDPNGTPDDANDDRWVDGDYHLKSQAGRWDPPGGSWVQDGVTSPCIDAGDPGVPVGDEPQPDGGRINMGAYGGTIEASKSRSVAGDGLALANTLKGNLTEYDR